MCSIFSFVPQMTIFSLYYSLTTVFILLFEYYFTTHFFDLPNNEYDHKTISYNPPKPHGNFFPSSFNAGNPYRLLCQCWPCACQLTNDVMQTGRKSTEGKRSKPAAGTRINIASCQPVSQYSVSMAMCSGRDVFCRESANGWRYAWCHH